MPAVDVPAPSRPGNSGPVGQAPAPQAPEASPQTPATSPGQARRQQRQANREERQDQRQERREQRRGNRQQAHGSGTPRTQTIDMPAMDVPAPRRPGTAQAAPSGGNATGNTGRGTGNNTAGNAGTNTGSNAGTSTGANAGTTAANPSGTGNAGRTNAVPANQPAAAAATGSVTPGKFKISASKDATIMRQRPMGRYMTLRELKFTAQVELEVTWRASSSQGVSVNATQAQVGQEFEHSLNDLIRPGGLPGIDLKEKHGWSGSPDGHDVGMGLECELFERGSVEFRFNAIERSADNGAGVGVFHAIAQVNVARFLSAYRDRITNPIQQRLRSLPFPGPTTEVKLKVTGGFDVSVQPQWREILIQARQLYPRLAQAAVSAGRTAAQAVASVMSAEVVIAAGFVTGGVVAIAAPLAQLDENDRAIQLARQTGQGAMQLCRAYESTLRTGAAGGSSNWARQGEQMARRALQQHAQGVDEAAFRAEIANQPNGALARRIWNANWSRIKDETVRHWEEQRSWASRTFGGTQATNHLRRVLSTYDDPSL